MITKNYIQVLEDSEESRLIQVTNEKHIQIHALEFIFQPVTEKTEPKKLITLYNSQDKLFWWNRSNLTRNKHRLFSKAKKNAHALTKIDSFLAKWSIQLSNQKIICFTFLGVSLGIIESRDTWESYDEAFQSVRTRLETEPKQFIPMAGGVSYNVSAIPEFLKSVKNKKLYNYQNQYIYRTINIDKYITDAYFYQKYADYTTPIQVKMVAVTRHNNTWQVELEGASQRNATFLLDDNYEVLEAWGKAVEGPRIFEH
ncbi:hypothetical protein PN36_33300 [Candidatus Thiomargarita nelsonii]|uniref:Uncharacterized protein n=1 Tax=Candidatus Thiomargarita nelsonii TaxID=1003181 RepID=A0A4E0RL72_9GAMM|nr:hypothetical protein PN36_33300 [Candidatus Thiomargarita nelsonii]